MVLILLVGTAAVVTVAMVVPAVLLARRSRLGSAKASWCTLGLAAIVLVATIAQAHSIWGLVCFCSSNMLMTLVGWPLSRFRVTA